MATEYRYVREEWNYDRSDSHGYPTREYVESSFDDELDRIARRYNEYGIFKKDGHYQMEVIKSIGDGRMVGEDAYEEYVIAEYSWMHPSDLRQRLIIGQVIDVPVIEKDKEITIEKVGLINFSVPQEGGEKMIVTVLYLGGTIVLACDYSNVYGELVIPSSINGLEVNRVEGFYSCDMTRLVLSEGITALGDKAFVKCANLKEIVFPGTLSWIPSDAFECCYSLRRVVIPESARKSTFGHSWNYIFKNLKNQLDGIYKSEDDEHPDVQFYSDPEHFEFALPKYVKGTVKIREGVRALSAWAFKDCKELTEVVIPGSVEYIYEGAFYNCENLKRVVFQQPSSLREVGKLAFLSCTNLEDFVLPDSIRILEKQAFAGCDKLTKIVLPYNLLYFSDLAFCKNLEEVSIPPLVESIDIRAFAGCKNLKKIIMLPAHNTPKELPTIWHDAFEKYHYENVTLLVPQELLDVYRGHKEWGLFLNIKPI